MQAGNASELETQCEFMGDPITTISIKSPHMLLDDLV